VKIEIVAMGKVKDKHYKALTQEYLGRLEHYVRVEHTELRESKARATAVRLAEEADKMRERCGPHTVMVAMDERGKTPTSEQLAAWCERWMVSGTRHVAFFIGSASGLDEGLREECDEVLALSAMTLPHEMARMMLAEQLYRAMTILRGEA